jgi:hypothetical protein
VSIIDADFGLRIGERSSTYVIIMFCIIYSNNENIDEKV